MASAQAKIDIVVKNLRSLNRLDKTLDKLNATNQSLISGIDKLTKSINNLSKARGLDDISVSANKASASVGKVIDKTNVLQTLGRRARGNFVNAGIAGGMAGGGALAGGVLGGGAAINTSMGVLNKIQRALHMGTTNVNGYAAAWAGIKATAIPAIKLMGAAVASSPVFSGIAAALLVTFGDKIWDTTKKIDGLGRSIFKIGQSAGNELQAGLLKASFGFKPVRTEIELTTQALLKLDERFKAPRGIITSRNRAFGIRQKGTATEEEARMRNRRINERAAEDRQARMIAAGNAPISRDRKRAIRLDSEFKNLPTVKAARSIEAVEKKRLLIAKRNLRINERLVKIGNNRKALGLVTPGRNANTITGFSADQYGPQQAPPMPLSRIEQMGFGKRANAQGMFASRGGMGGRLRGAGSSAMIGGMFPLLFGQGGAASLGGGLGGLAGGALGGGLGFGLSLFGTVIGSKVQEAADFRKEIDKLNTSIKGTGGTSVFTVEKIKDLAKSLGVTKEEALQAAGSFEQFGAAARATLLQAFPDEETFNYFSNIKNNQSLLEGMLDMQKKIGFEQSRIAIEVLRTQGFRAAELFLLTKTLEKQKQARIDAAKEKNSKIKGGELVGDLGSMLQQIDEANINKEFEDMKKEAEELINKTKEWNRELEKAMMVSQIKDELIKLQDPMFQIVEAANAIGDAFSSSFKGIVSGSMSAQEALANLFKRTADHFLDMAAQILAAQVRAKIVGMFANSFGGGTTAPAGAFGIGSKSTDIVSRHVAGHSSIQPKFASGGYVTSPTVGLIGEAGEDEYVIPASKMASSMQRYSAGARGDSVIPGTGQSSAGVASGSSTTVNYSGPILNFNSEEFVPKSAVGQIINSAVARGAAAGENRTLSTLKNSRSRRSSLGL